MRHFYSSGLTGLFVIVALSLTFASAFNIPTDGDCSSSHDRCQREDECCGEATPLNGGLTTLRCSSKDATRWNDPMTNKKYWFECAPPLTV